MKIKGDFEQYLASLAELKPLRTSAEMAQELWKQLRKKIPALPLPVAFPIDDDRLQLSWTSGPYHLSVDIFSTKWDWFFRNRASGKIDGGEGQAEGEEVFMTHLLDLVAYDLAVEESK